MTEMRRIPDRRILDHTPLDLGCDFLSLFDARAEKSGFCADFVHCRWVEGVVGCVLCWGWICIGLLEGWDWFEEDQGSEAFVEGFILHALLFEEPAPVDLAV